MDNSKGRYWDKPLSLVDGCTPCSPGCDHCWSMAMAKRFHKWPEKATVRPDRLDIPLRTKKPTTWALWNDLYHEDVPDEFRDRAYAVMALCPQHTFLVLTKRSGGMARYVNLSDGQRDSRCGTRRSITLEALDITCEAAAKNPKSTVGRGLTIGENDVITAWPFPNVWHGLTVCNQQEADEKIPDFLKIPGKKFLSIEPMLGPLNLVSIPIGKRLLPLGKSEPLFHNCLTRRSYFTDDHLVDVPRIDLVILGGETGPGARVCNPEWSLSVKDQCVAAGIPFFFKGHGKYRGPHPGWYQPSGRLLDGKEWNELAWRASEH